jgi:hypothetical protein
MTLIINHNSSENTGFLKLAEDVCISLFSTLQEVLKNMPAFLSKEETAGLGVTHQVTTASENQLQLKAFARAKRDAANDSLRTAEHIQDYQLTDQNMLFEIAKIIAAHDSKAINQFIQNFGITDQNRLFEIAKIAATNAGWGTSKYIQNYGITDQNMLFEIAKIAAANDGWGLINLYIQNFGITDQNMLFEIAKIVAASSGGRIIKFIEKYGRIDQDGLFEIAKIAAAHDGVGTSEFIHYYGIIDQDRLFEIAKIAAAQNGRGTSEFIHNYGIIDQERLFEIAKIAAAQDGLGTTEFIHNYSISKDQHLQILQICFAPIASIALETNNFYTLKRFAELRIVLSKEKFFEMVAQTCAMEIPFEFETTEEKKKVEEGLKEAFNQLKDFAIQSGASDKILASFEEIIFKKHTSLQQQQKDLLLLGVWVMHYSLNLSENSLKQSPLSDEEMAPLLNCILKTIDSNLRSQATNALIAGYKDPQKNKLVKNLMKELNDERLYLIVLFSTVAGVEAKTTKKVCDELPKAKYKDAKLMAPINELMGALYKSSSLSPEEKERLLGLIFQPLIKVKGEFGPDFHLRLDLYRKSRQNWIAAVHFLLSFGQEEIMKNIASTTELVSQWKTFMGKNFHIKTDLLDKFFLTFGSSKRYPNGLIIYATRLQTLPKEERDVLMPLLGKFIGAVLDGTFPKMRYSFTDNIHLKTIFSGNEELLKKWQTPFPIVQVQKLMQDALENRQGILAGNFKESNEDILRNCAIVLNPKTTLPELKSALIELQKLFPSEDDQFHHNLKDMMAKLDPQSSESFTIEDTDDWEDIEMMGTEVDNSCQNLLGEPTLNKCLLASYLDGKIRLMVARDKISGKIVGRVVFRVHPDANNNTALFVEKLYTRKGVNEELIRQNILEGCQQKAQSMGIALTASVSGYSDLNAPKYPGALKALGGPAPYEYVDALGGRQKGGIYSIPESFLLWTPFVPQDLSVSGNLSM